MAVRSHVDPATFIRIMYVDSAGLPSELLQTLEVEPDHDAFWKLWTSERSRRSDIHFHETYHFWQGVRLPYVHRYAILAFRRIFEGFRFAARELGNDPSEWTFELPELYVFTHRFECFVMANATIGIRATSDVPAPPDASASFSLSDRDLLEAGASLAEWNVYAANRYQHLSAVTNVTYFKRWRKARPAFLDAFDLIATTLEDDELALRCALPLICAAFHTNRPVVALCHLIVALARQRERDAAWQRFVSQREPCRWVEFTENLLDQIRFEAPPDFDAAIASDKFFRLTIKNWAYGHYPKSPLTLHPVLTERARDWIEAEESTLPGLRWIMAQPNWVTEDAVEYAWKVEPPVTVARIALPSGRTRVICFRQFREKEPVFGLTELGDAALLDLLTVVSVMKRVTGSHYHPDHRLCSHATCPHFAGNLCNTYFNIPDRFDECGFPRRLQHAIEKLAKEVDSGD